MLRFTDRRFRARTVCALLFVSAVLSLVLISCKKKASPYGLMIEFCQSYGIEDTVFSPSLDEGDTGYAEDGFFELLFDEKPHSVSDYAIVFLSSLDYAGECAVLLCYSESDALMTLELMQMRIDLIRSMATGIDVSSTDDARVFKSGKYVVMCALPDNDRAERIWRKVL